MNKVSLVLQNNSKDKIWKVKLWNLMIWGTKHYEPVSRGNSEKKQLKTVFYSKIREKPKTLRVKFPLGICT